jgi:hypothetical protein
MNLKLVEKKAHFDSNQIDMENLNGELHDEFKDVIFLKSFHNNIQAKRARDINYKIH